MPFGFVLAQTLRKQCVNPITFIAVEAVTEWLHLCYKWTLPCLIKVDCSNYEQQNEVQLLNSMQNNEIRLFPAERTRTSRCALVATVGGLLTALSVGLGSDYAKNDAHVLSIILVILASTRLEKISFTALAVYTWLVQPFPCAHGVLRSLVIVAGFVLRGAFLPDTWKCLRLISSFIAISFFPNTCTSIWGGLSPVTVLSVAAYVFFLSPATIVSFSLLFLLL